MPLLEVEQYTHLLIAADPEYAPPVDVVAGFLTALQSLGAVPAPDELRLLSFSRSTPDKGNGRAKKGMGARHVVRTPWHFEKKVKLAGANKLGRAAAGMEAFDVVVEGMGRPAAPPLRVAFEQPYHLSVKCRVRPCAVWLSCASEVEEESSSPVTDFNNKEATREQFEKWMRRAAATPVFTEPCSPDHRVGKFNNPQTGAVVSVPNAGSARFWIEFELGKWLIPRVNEADFDILDSTVLALARHQFGVDFAQGCLLF